jgi:tetratricopeptide (TPR) repeat protein
MTGSQREANSPRWSAGWKACTTICLVAIVLFIPGCVSPAQQEAQEAVTSYLMGDYLRSTELLKPLAEKTNEDFVLNNDRLGSASLAATDFDIAESAFLRSYEVINSVGVNDGGRSLGAVLVSERIKVWKGEPFERAMVNFYLGVIYYIRHDYGNARGAFENALFKLRDYGEGQQKNDQYKEVESNFVLGYLMLARSYQRLGRADLAQKNFDRVVQLRPDFASLASASTNEQSNLLLIVDVGFAPRKATNGDGAFVGFHPTPREAGPIPLPSVVVDGRMEDLQNLNLPPVDLVAMAADRKWEDIDTIRAIKSVAGTALVAAGVGNAAFNHHSDPAVTLGLIAGGLLLKATSQADTRQWEMLPRTVFVLPLHIPPGKHDVTVEFPAWPGVRQQWQGLDVPQTGESTYYLRLGRYDVGPYMRQPHPTRPPPQGVY